MGFSLNDTAYASEIALPKTCSFYRALGLDFKPQFIGPDPGSGSPSDSWLFYQPGANSALMHSVQMPGAGDSPGPLGACRTLENTGDVIQ